MKKLVCSHRGWTLSPSTAAQGAGSNAVHETAAPAQWASAVGRHQPELLLLHVQPWNDHALQALQSLCALHPQLPVVAVCDELQQAPLMALMRCGVREVMDTRSDVEGLHRVLNSLQHAEPVTAVTAVAPLRGRTLAFFGAKGGCGTTTAAVAAACALSASSTDADRRAGARVLLLDLCQGDADMHLCLDTPSHHLGHFMQNLSRLDGPLIDTLVHRVRPGLDLVAGLRWQEGLQDGLHRGRQSGQHDEDQYTDPAPLLQALGAHYDHLVLDLGSSTAALTDSLWSLIDQTVLVARPDLPCLRRTHELLDDWHQAQAHTAQAQAAHANTAQAHAARLPVWLPGADASSHAAELDEYRRLLGAPSTAAHDARVRALPWCDRQARQALLRGRSLFDEQPRGAYAKAVLQSLKALGLGCEGRDQQTRRTASKASGQADASSMNTLTRFKELLWTRWQTA